jgi:hypothetical protein
MLIIAILVIGALALIDFNSEEKTMREFCKTECRNR